MSDNWFFGYGSLVNRATHDYARVRPARVKGWRRVWRHTPLRPVAFLTAVPCPASEIDGLVAEVPGGDWSALDAREMAYDRVDASDAVVLGRDAGTRIAIYHIAEGRHGAPDARHPALLSYLDVVVQGYLREFGEVGAQAFFDTTDGWDAPVLDDRTAPVYPRHQVLGPKERAFIDGQIAARGITLIHSRD